eukprot:NODE_11044_length_566_cov_58.433409_g10764_i0.p1 GENE.NODE_11044_length_566_cov_58.433409_g10764_i0~~NODE_11044_length_566_cov_58.433409_g10764_i0.p1  ORF type:complete len:129 (-),score=24.44 NODE_11044_length_566_cov_58.433409_g10764_i0:83-469(-)
MPAFTTALYGLHVFCEALMGTMVLLSGAYPYEDAAARKIKAERNKMTARFHAAGLLALAYLGVAALQSGPSSAVGKMAGNTCLIFHGLGMAGFAMSIPKSGFAKVASNPAFILHGILATGFVAEVMSR